MTNESPRLKAIGEEARDIFAKKFKVRENSLQLHREVIRSSANAIRAIHRGQFDAAGGLIEDARKALSEIEGATNGYPDVYYAGFIEDAQKEFAEANTTLAFIAGTPLASPQELGVGFAPYLNGLGEAVGELRRYILDALRHNDTSRCEEVLNLMDEVYTLLVTIDFPESITGGLRRTTDMVRGTLERTRGDLTTALRQSHLEERLSAFEKGLPQKEK